MFQAPPLVSPSLLEHSTLATCLKFGPPKSGPNSEELSGIFMSLWCTLESHQVAPEDLFTHLLPLTHGLAHMEQARINWVWPVSTQISSVSYQYGKSYSWAHNVEKIIQTKGRSSFPLGASANIQVNCTLVFRIIHTPAFENTFSEQLQEYLWQRQTKSLSTKGLRSYIWTVLLHWWSSQHGYHWSSSKTSSV